MWLGTALALGGAPLSNHAPAPSWSPGDVADLQADYDPMNGVTVVGGEVTAVVNQAGVGGSTRNLATRTGGLSKVKLLAADPTYGGQDVFHFDRAEQDQALESLAWATPIVGAYSVYLVGDVAGNEGYLWQGGTTFTVPLQERVMSADQSFYGGPAYPTLGVYNSQSNMWARSTAPDAPTQTVPSVMAFTFTSALAKGFSNDPVDPVLSGDIDSAGLPAFLLGSCIGFSLRGKIARALIYAGAHDDATVLAVCSGLSTRYAIALN